MIDKCCHKLQQGSVTNYQLVCDKIENIDFKKSKLIIMNYTLQFIPVEQRLPLLKRIFKSLENGGILILSEKIISESNDFNPLLTTLYYDFKRRNGYSELEIHQKREALENVLIPLTPSDQLELLKRAGFQKEDMIFRWYNFACFMGIK